jgi:hypothetical protein
MAARPPRDPKGFSSICEMPNHPLPMPIMDRSSDIRIYSLNVALFLNASQQPSWQRSAEAPVLDGLESAPKRFDVRSTLIRISENQRARWQ